MPPKTIIGVLGCPIRKNREGEIEYFLTQRYAPQNPKYHLKWQQAGGGLEFGESPEETLVREFQEELGVTPEILFPFPIIRSSRRKYPNRHIHLILISYIVSIADQTPKNTDPDHETSDMGWFTYDAIQELENIEDNLFFINKIIRIIKSEKLSI